MTQLAASGLATGFALVMLGSSAVATLQGKAEPPKAAPPEAVRLVDATPLGECRIEYEHLASDRQPAAMECEHAKWVAQRWGGRVIEKTGDGYVERANYQGPNDFSGVPSSALPRPGYCRAWIDGRTVEDQPVESDCRTAARIAALERGRVLFIPL